MAINFVFINNLICTQEAQIKLNRIPFLVRIQALQFFEELTQLAELEKVTVDIVEQACSEFSQ